MPLILGPATNNASLKVTLPAGVTTGPVRVNTPAGSSTSSSNFVVLPTLFSFSPGAGAPGSSITLTGANFNVGTPIVRFSGVVSSNISGVSFGQLTAIVPSGATNGLVSITTSAGSHTNSTLFFLPPLITGFSPSNSAPGSTINVTGQNLLGTTNVTFNGTSARFTPPVNNTSAQVVVPTNFSTGSLTLNTPGGAAISSNLFYATPIISGFNPTHGLPGANITITGSNFLGATSVRFNGTSASFTSPTDNTTIHAVVPASAQTGVITVTGPAGTGTSPQAFVLDNSDLVLALLASPNPVIIGSNLTYLASVTNLGSVTASNVRITDTLPSSVNIKNVSPSQGSVLTNGNQITALLGSLNVGSSATLTLLVAPQILGNITNVATAQSDISDPVLANNSATVTTFVLPLPVLSATSLSPNRIRIAWPVTLTNFTLESRTNMVSGNAWSAVPATPVISGNERAVIQTNTAASTFYRLRSP
jgi:uncharacterized repeat protein (TIGR01451 family)